MRCLLATALAAMAWGCSSTTSGASSSAPDASWPVCPDSPPAAGAACTQPMLQCEYGDAWWSLACNTVVQCSHGWQPINLLGQTCAPQPGPNPETCAASAVMVPVGSKCDTPGLTCFYGKGASCACLGCTGSGCEADAGASWGCLDPNCPVNRPRLGSACAPKEEGPGCPYLEGSVYVNEACLGGVWQQTLCPCGG
jgi:hypothetical protein